jgi:hypothetical protein
VVLDVVERAEALAALELLVAFLCKHRKAR